MSEGSRAQSIARCGLCVALLAVSAMFTVPIGPVPITLQTCIVTLCALILSPREACASVGGYLLLGAIGLPVFSGMRGGLGVIAGPTGGFLYGFLIGVAAGSLLRHVLSAKVGRDLPLDIIAAVAVMAFSYLCGWAQLMLVANMGPLAAFAAGIAPFIVLDAVKCAASIVIAVPVRAALRYTRARA